MAVLGILQGSFNERNKFGKRIGKFMKCENKESFFSVGATQHLILFIFLGFVLAKWIVWYHLVWMLFLVGFMIELLEMSALWAKIMNWMGEKEGKAVVISWQDLCVNVLGSVMGIVAQVL